MRLAVTVTPEDFEEAAKAVGHTGEVLEYCRGCVIGRAVERTLRDKGIQPLYLGVHFNSGMYTGQDGIHHSFTLSEELIKIRNQFDYHRSYMPFTESVQGYIEIED